MAEAFFDFVTNDLANAVEHLVAKLVDGTFGKVHGARLGQCTFGDHDNAVFFTQLESAFHCFGYFGNIEGNLGDDNIVGAASHASVQGNPPHVSAHDLHDHHPVVGFRGGVQPVDGISGDGHRSVETERVVGAVHVIINGFRHTHNRDAIIG